MVKKHSPRLVGGAERGDRQQSGEDHSKVGLAKWETKDSKLTVKYWWGRGVVATVGETPSLIGEFIGKWG